VRGACDCALKKLTWSAQPIVDIGVTEIQKYQNIKKVRGAYSAVTKLSLSAQSKADISVTGAATSALTPPSLYNQYLKGSLTFLFVTLHF